MDTRSFVLNRALAVLSLSLILVSSSWAAKVSGKILHSFSGPDGSTPTGALAVDALGNVYGTTALGGVGSGCGSSACGVVYELSPSGNGTSETILWTFANGPDGGGPQGGVIRDSTNGNLYGTTLFGGSGDGCGTVFQLVPVVGGGWTKNILHSFNSMSGDACFPYSGLTLSAGNLYGTTASGGTYDTGAVFELTPNSNGTWNYSVIYNFQAGGSGDGANPHGTVVFDSSGNLYGTTLNGGVNNAGTVFEMTPANGEWTETVIYTFDGSHGANPYSGVIVDNTGNLFGMTYGGGAYGLGVAFELSLSGATWTIQTIHTFTGGSDGANPGPGSLLMDTAGNLYGEALYGGRTFGVVFELIPQNGVWNETILHAFLNKADGRNPEGGLTMDSAGNLYGSDLHGGSGGDGIVFEGRVN